MKKVKFLAIILLVVVSIMALVGCSGINIKYGEAYNHVFYSRSDGKFVESGNSIMINDDRTYEETFDLGVKGKRKVVGRYHVDKRHDFLYLQSNISSISSLKNEINTALKQKGYTSSDINNVIMPGITGDGELYTYKDYMFKLADVAASRIGEEKDVAMLEGVYGYGRMFDAGSSKSSKLKLNAGKVYKCTIGEFGDELYEEVMGSYVMNGDFMIMTPIKDGKEEKPMRYLVAEVEFPTTFREKVDDNGRYDGNPIVTIYDSVKVRVLVGSFYTQKTTK